MAYTERIMCEALYSDTRPRKSGLLQKLFKLVLLALNTKLTDLKAFWIRLTFFLNFCQQKKISFPSDGSTTECRWLKQTKAKTYWTTGHLSYVRYAWVTKVRSRARQATVTVQLLAYQQCSPCSVSKILVFDPTRCPTFVTFFSRNLV